MQPVVDIIALAEDRLHADAGHGGREVGHHRIGSLRPLVHAQFGLEVGGDEDRAPPAGKGHGRRRCPRALLDLGDVADADELAIGAFGQGDRADPVEAVEFSGDLDIEVDRVGAQLAGRRLGIGAGCQTRQVGHGQAQCGEGLRIGQNADLLLDRAMDPGLLGAGEIAQARFQIVGQAREDRHVLRAPPLPAQRHDHGGRAGIAAFHIRRAGARRQLRAHALDLLADQRPGLVDIVRRQVLAHLQRDDGNARARIRTGLVDLGQFMDGVFQRFGNQRLDPLGGRAEEDGHDRAEALGQRRVFLAAQGHQRAQTGGDEQNDRQRRQPRITVEERTHCARASIAAGVTR